MAPTGRESSPFAREQAFAHELATAARAIMLENFSPFGEVSYKDDRTPVTRADVLINELVVQKVREQFPHDGVIGEESSYEPTRPRVWLVDPVDGTHPYSLGIPLSTCCLTLAVGGVAQLACVEDPFTDRYYEATRGQGALMNGRTLRVASSGTLDQAYVILSARLGDNLPTTGHLYDQITNAGAKSFIYRSSAYSCMLVASGLAVGYIGGHVKAWDAAAARMIVEEAGGKVTDFYGRDFDYNRIDAGFVASNGACHDQLLALVTG